MKKERTKNKRGSLDKVETLNTLDTLDNLDTLDLKEKGNEDKRG